jgi:hypothetical protein
MAERRLITAVEHDSVLRHSEGAACCRWMPTAS